MTFTKTTEAMIIAAEKSGAILANYFKKNIPEHSKGSGYYDVCSEADLKSEEKIIKTLHQLLPHINILSEEKGFLDMHSEESIVVDPLDGSSNFLLGIPHFSVSMAYIKNGQILSSVIYQPILSKLYVAELNKGSFLNNKKINSKSQDRNFYAAINFDHKIKWSEKVKIFNKLYSKKAGRVLNNWSPNLDYCLLAANKIDAVIANNSSIFDYAPGLLLATESGCTVIPKPNIQVSLKNTAQFVISNKQTLSQSLITLLNK